MTSPPSLTDDTQPGTFHVLMVCTGNICRSPAAERLLRARLTDTDVTVTSAGTHAVQGAAISEPMVPFLTAAGATSEGFSARQLDARTIEGADAILTLTRAHRALVVEHCPAAVRRAFTLRELARLCAGLSDTLPAGTPAVRFAALVAAASTHRSAHPAGPAGDDVVDPYRRGDAAYAESFGQLAPAVEAIAAAVRG